MQYSFPHEEYNIIDNTERSIQDVSVNGISLLMPFISPKGEDGKVITLKDYTKTLRDYGTPDLMRDGQAYYQVLNWLKGGGIVHGIRVTAEDARYSNLLVSLDIKITQSEDGQTKKAVVDLITESAQDIKSNNKETAKAQFKAKEVNDEESGHYVVPLFMAICKGRGIYGDSFRVRLTPSMSYSDRTGNHKMYIFEMYSNELKKVDEAISVCLNPSALNSFRRNVYIETMVKNNYYPVNLYSNDSAFNKLTNILLPVVQQEHEDVDANHLDTLFGLDMEGTPYKNVTYNTNLLSALEGVRLGLGSDGNFDLSKTDRHDNISKRYVKVLQGDDSVVGVDRNIFNTKKYPALIMLDANFPQEVKRALQTCADKRGGCPLHLDAGILSTLTAAKAWRRNEMQVDNYFSFIHFQNFNTMDEYNSVEINVTTSYLYSLLLPTHFKSSNGGTHIALAGQDFAITDVIIDGTLKPCVIDDDDRQELYNLRLNYLEELTYNKISIETEVTSQSKLSELSYINNVYVLHEMITVLKQFIPSFRYKFIDKDSEIETLTRMANAKLEAFRDYKCKDVTVRLSQSKQQKENKVLKTTIGTIFREFSEVNLVDVEINRY